jgi:hypothetical protein
MRQTASRNGALKMTSTYATPAVTEYQKLSALVDRRIEENDSMDNVRFWLDRYHTAGTEIAERHGLTILDLVDAWTAWCDAIDADRKAKMELSK